MSNDGEYIEIVYGPRFRTVMICVGLVALFGLLGSYNRKQNVSRRQTCQTTLESSGLTKNSIRRLTDGEVASKCGFLPEIPVNSVWHDTRERPVGVAEKAEEMLACGQKFEAIGLTYEDMAKASDVETAIVCDAVPALH